MPKKTIDEKIDDLAIITVKGFRRVEGRLGVLESDVATLKDDVAELKTDVADLKGDVADLKGDVAELKGDVAELKIGDSWTRHAIELMAIDIKEIKSRLDDVELRLKYIEELNEDEQNERVQLKKELTELKKRVVILETRLQ